MERVWYLSEILVFLRERRLARTLEVGFALLRVKIIGRILEWRILILAAVFLKLSRGKLDNV